MNDYQLASKVSFLHFLLLFAIIHTSFPAFLLPRGTENAAVGVAIAGVYLLFKGRLSFPIVLSVFAMSLMVFGLGISKQISPEALMQTIMFSFMPIIVLKFLQFVTVQRAIVCIRAIYYVWVALSVAALAGIGGLISPILRFLFSASSGLQFTLSGRGGSGLTFPEQSHIAPYIALFVFCLMFHGGPGDRKIAVVGLIPIVIVNGSRTLIVLLLAVFALQFFTKAVFSLKSVLQILFLLLFVYFVISSNQFMSNSIEGLFSLFLNFDINQTTQLMSGRAIANYVYLFDLSNYPLGHGFELTRDYFFAAADTLNINYRAIGAFDRTGREGLPIYPRSYLVYFVYSYGILGIIFVIAMTRYFCKNVSFSALTALAFLQIFLIGLPSLTAPWLTLGIAKLLYQKRNELDQEESGNITVASGDVVDAR